MKAPKKRTKKYQPRFVSTNPLSDFFGGLSGDHAEHFQRLALRNHTALLLLEQGKGGKEQWDLIVGAINIANVMCEQGIGDEFRATTIAARDALLEVGKRALKTGRFLFKGDELKAVRAALECHDAQLENVRAIDVERASDEVIRRIRHGLNTTNVRAEVEREHA